MTTAADYINLLDETLIRKTINSKAYNVLLNNMGKILDNLNHQQVTDPLKIHTYSDGFKIYNSAYERIYSNAGLYYERWFIAGKVGREEDKPSYVEYYFSENKIKSQTWYTAGSLAYREVSNLPTVINYYENGVVKKEEWWKDNVRHRDGDDPAEIAYYDNGKKRMESWFHDGNQFIRRGAKFSAVRYDIEQ